MLVISIRLRDVWKAGRELKGTRASDIDLGLFLHAYHSQICQHDTRNDVGPILLKGAVTKGFLADFRQLSIIRPTRGAARGRGGGGGCPEPPPGNNNDNMSWEFAGMRIFRRFPTS